MRPRQNKFEKARDAMREQIHKACVCEKENGVARLKERNGMRKMRQRKILVERVLEREKGQTESLLDC